MNTSATYDFDCAIIGGGLAGLSLSILMAERGWKTVLFEKNKYPFHRVCGEYVSLESKPFLERLGMWISPDQFPHINKLQVSSVQGTIVNRPLDMGGFGISRYTLDNELAKIASNKGVQIIYERVDDIHQKDDRYDIQTKNSTYSATACVGSFGKRSNLDIKWNRPFVLSKNKGLNNFLGIKYHVRIDHPKELIALHNFKNGYCGISAIEEDKYCLCYLTRGSNLTENSNDISSMETKVLQQSPALKMIFQHAEFLYDEPLVISQISFVNKAQVQSSVPLVGDATGLITPLCGNGMSMALRASHILAPFLHQYLEQSISLAELSSSYQQLWQKEFKHRLTTGRLVQQFFGSNLLTEILLKTCQAVPSLADLLIRSTHGKAF